MLKKKTAAAVGTGSFIMTMRLSILHVSSSTAQIRLPETSVFSQSLKIAFEREEILKRGTD